jgi:hypothetical protein
MRQISLHAAQDNLREVRVAAAQEVANFLFNHKRKEIQTIEEQFHCKIVITAQHGLAPENLQIEFVKAATPEPAAGKSETKEPKSAQQVDEIRPGKISAPVPPQGHGPHR